jgi:hypothetical protein
MPGASWHFFEGLSNAGAIRAGAGNSGGRKLERMTSARAPEKRMRTGTKGRLVPVILKKDEDGN